MITEVLIENNPTSYLGAGARFKLEGHEKASIDGHGFLYMSSDNQYFCKCQKELSREEVTEIFLTLRFRKLDTKRTGIWPALYKDIENECRIVIVAVYRCLGF